MKASELMPGQRAHLTCGCLIEIPTDMGFSPTRPGIYARIITPCEADHGAMPSPFAVTYFIIAEDAEVRPLSEAATG